MILIRDFLFQKIQNQKNTFRQLHQNKYLNQREYLNAQKIMEGMCLKLKNYTITHSTHLKQVAVSFRDYSEMLVTGSRNLFS